MSRGVLGSNRQPAVRDSAARSASPDVHDIRPVDYRFDPFVAVADLTADAVFVWSEGVIRWANRGAGAMFGGERGSQVGAPFVNLVAPEHRALTETLGRTRHPEPYECDGLRLDGSVFPMEVCGRDIIWEGRRAWLVVVRDLEPLRRSEEALAQRVAELRAASERLWSQAVELDTLRSDLARRRSGGRDDEG